MFDVTLLLILQTLGFPQCYPWSQLPLALLSTLLTPYYQRMSHLTHFSVRCSYCFKDCGSRDIALSTFACSSQGLSPGQTMKISANGSRAIQMRPLLFSFPPPQEGESDPSCAGSSLSPQPHCPPPLSPSPRELQLGRLGFLLLSVAPLPCREELRHWEGCFPLGNLHFLLQLEQENSMDRG